MKTKSSSGVKVKAGIKSGGLYTMNHARSGLKIKTAIKAAGLYTMNHSQPGLKVKTGIKAAGNGIWQNNHSLRLQAVV